MGEGSNGSNGQTSRGRSISKGAILLLVGAALPFAPMLLDTLLLQGEPRSGQSDTVGIVIRALESVSSSSATGNKPNRMSYHYAVDGDPYCSGGRVAPVTTDDVAEYCSDAWQQVNRATVQAYETGDSIRLFYDVDKPWVSVPTQVPHRRSPWMWAGAFLVGIGALVIWTSVRGPFDFTKSQGTN